MSKEQDKDDAQMHALGEQIIALVEMIMAGRGKRASIPLSYNFPAMGLSQDFTIHVEPEGEAQVMSKEIH